MANCPRKIIKSLLNFCHKSLSKITYQRTSPHQEILTYGSGKRSQMPRLPYPNGKRVSYRSGEKPGFSGRIPGLTVDCQKETRFLNFD
jgi:hypothetical protein